MAHRTLIERFISQQFQGTVNNKVAEIIKEESEKAGKEVAKRVLELAAQVQMVIQKSTMDYMMTNEVRIHVHILGVKDEQT